MDLYVEILASTIRYTVPLILACIAGLWSERSGIVDIGLEGKMLIAAFVAASGSAVYGSAWIGLALASAALLAADLQFKTYNAQFSGIGEMSVLIMGEREAVLILAREAARLGGGVKRIQRILEVARFYPARFRHFGNQLGPEWKSAIVIS